MNTVYLVMPNTKKDCILYGVEYLADSLRRAGYTIKKATEEQAIGNYRQFDAPAVYVGSRDDSALIQKAEEEQLLLYHTHAPKGEGFYLHTLPGRFFVVAGGSEVGALYGCVELAERIDREGGLPHEIFYGDEPVCKLRGPVVGLQLTKIEPPRKTYEYPITKSRFPWFYDRELWIEFLEMMVKNRCNVLYIWSGHPFASLVRVPDYPEALEVTDEEFALNQETFTWLATECGRRGIWLVLKFYNIHISYPFAVAHDLELLQSDIHPLVADYTYKSIVEFMKTFPNVGLMVCLGEALRGQQNKTDWFLKTILPAVKEGVRQAGLETEPPLILRGHDCDADTILREAMKTYSNIYTMWKYNGESLTTYFPTGEWQKIHQNLSSHGQPHIMNVHVLADLEPFRYGAPSFIQKCMQAGCERLGGNGLHLYPLFYWDWPYSADKTTPRLKAVERDWMWYDAWFRYAWNPYRGEREERMFWVSVLCDRFGCGNEAGEQILDAIEAAGECAPRILRRVGITEGNRQTWSLGMTMTEFTHVKKYRPNLELWKSVSTPGEQPDDYVRKELAGEPHFGETPYDMVGEVRYYANRAWEQANNAKASVTRNETEFQYLLTDIQAIRLISLSYGKKIEAAMNILFYKETMDEQLRGDLQLLRDAREQMKESLDYYRAVCELTKDTYLYANSMQTPQRKIPFPDGEAFGHWTQCLPEYEREFENFDRHLTDMENGIYPETETEEERAIQPLPNAVFRNLSEEDYPEFTVGKGVSVFSDRECKIQACAPELCGLRGLQLNRALAESQGATLTLEFDEDVQVLIGYFRAKGKENKYLKVPDLETNTHADDRGGLAVVFEDAVKVEDCPVVNVRAFQYEKGKHRIFLDVGSFVFLGVVPASHKLRSRQAGLAGDTLEMLDWMFS
ncbi:MAG: hypothetical protein ACLU61_02820 [Lachnospiraceae bacterium]